MDRHDVRDVFTPTKPAILTFVDRKSINNKLFDALKTPGKQIVVYGHSGSGKTTLLENKLRQMYEAHLTTRCMSGMTFEELILDAFDQLAPFYESQMTTALDRRQEGSLSAQYAGIKAQIGRSNSEDVQTRHDRVLPLQLTAQRLATFIGKSGRCWVLEDFHKIPSTEKTKLAQTMKIFMDEAANYNDLKIIAIGAVGTAREVVAYDTEMRNRVSEIQVPLMTDDEINTIIDKGQSLMNISIPTKVKEEIIGYSNGLASVCHQLSLNACFSSDILQTQDKKRLVTQESFQDALRTYIENESDSLKALFDLAFRQQRKRKYDNCGLILEALADDNGEDGMTRPEILHAIRKNKSTYPPGNLTSYLVQLQDETRGNIIAYDEVSARYSFANPFHKVYAKLYFSQESRRAESIPDKDLIAEMLKSLAIRLRRADDSIKFRRGIG